MDISRNIFICFCYLRVPTGSCSIPVENYDFRIVFLVLVTDSVHTISEAVTSLSVVLPFSACVVITFVTTGSVNFDSVVNVSLTLDYLVIISVVYTSVTVDSLGRHEINPNRKYETKTGLQRQHESKLKQKREHIVIMMGFEQVKLKRNLK